MKRLNSSSPWIKYIGGAIGGIAAGFILMFGGIKVAYPVVSDLVGLSVAQSATLWNSVADAAKGDSLTSGILAQATMLFNGTSFDRQRGSIANGAQVDVTRIVGNITPTDGMSNPTTLNAFQIYPMVFNTVSWDRLRTPAGDGLAQTGLLGVGVLGWNGATFDKFRTASGTDNTAATSLGAVQVAQLSTWSVINTSAGATAATASKALGGGTVRHVATGITVCFGDTAAAVTPLLVSLRDGATGAGTILRTWFLSSPTAGGTRCENVTGLNMSGTANTAMTLEFAAAPAATASETVTLTGYSTP